MKPPEPRGGLGQRLKQLLGPMLAGLVIDGLDLLTFGPIGLWTGMLLGGAVGFWLAPELGFPQRARWLCAALTGLYCTLPMTGFLPLATLVAGLSRLLDRSSAAEPSEADPAFDPEGAIEVEYRGDPDEPTSR